jgi:UDP-N-acetylmuramate dehydrogenase
VIVPDASLQGLNTFGVEARARGLARVADLASLPAILDEPDWRAAPLLVLGGGSNVLFTRDFDGLVVHIDAARIDPPRRDGDHALVRVEAGHDWHAFVRWTLDEGLAGLENLSLIPGTVGAAPIQNIGAYGVELESVIDAVEVYDRAQHRFDRLGHADCAFGYRDSVFKREPGRARWIVTAVHFRLRADAPLVLHYAGVREELAAMGVDPPTPRAVSDAIIALRRRKLPDPAVLGNAGSFFKNPVVPRAQAEALGAAHPGLPSHPAGAAQAKLSAAWLIERAGMKGAREGDAGVSDLHALVLVNHGHASGAQLLALARRVQAAVQERFGVALEPEPLIV